MSSTSNSTPVGGAAKVLSAEVQSQLAKLVHHSVKSRKDLCKELIETVESGERKKASDNATPSPPRPNSSTSVSSDKENQRASGSNAAPVVEDGEKDEKSVAATKYASLINSFLEQSAVYDARKSLWVLNDEVKKRWAVADKLHPFFLHALTTPPSPSPKRRRSAPEVAGPSKKPSPATRPQLVDYSPSPEPGPGPGPSGSAKMAEVQPSPGADEEDLAILKKHRFKNVAVHVINSPEIDAFLRRELPHAIDYEGCSPTTSRASSGRRQSSLKAHGKGKKTGSSRRQSVITGKFIRKKGKNKEVASSTSTSAGSKQKSLNAFFKPSTPANSSVASAKKRRLDATGPSVCANKSSTATPRSLAITAEDHRKQQLRANGRKIRKAVEEYNAREALKAARLAIKDFAPTATLPTAEELGINAFIHHLMARELVKRREKETTSTEANGGGEEGGPKKRGKKQPAGSNNSIDDEGYRKMEKLLGQLMNGKVEDLLAKEAPLPDLEPVPLPPTSPSAANDYTNFTMSLILTEWLTTFADLLGIGGRHRLPSSLQLLDATVDSTRESFHHCTGRALKAMVGYFLTKTDVGRAMVEQKMIGEVRSAAEAELSGHRKGAATSIGNAFKTAKLLLGVELVSNKDGAKLQEEPTEDPAEQLLREELASANDFWELPSDYQLELLRRMMELISDSNEFDTHLEASLSARSKAIEEKKEAEGKIAELLVNVDEAAANLPSTSDDALEQMTREQTRELVHKKKDLEAKQCELQELKERCQVLDTLLTQLRAGVSKLRVSPLGVDRWHRKYWFFTTSSPNRGLYVEDDGAGGSPEAASQMTELRTGMDFVERLQWDLDGWPLMDITRSKKSSLWYRIRTIGQFNSICASLSTRGVREEALRRKIKAVEEQILVTLEPGDDAVATAAQSSSAEKAGEEPLREGRDGADSAAGEEDRHDVLMEDESLEEARQDVGGSAGVIEISDDEGGDD